MGDGYIKEPLLCLCFYNEIADIHVLLLKLKINNMAAKFLTVEEGSYKYGKRGQEMNPEIGGISMHNGFLIYKDRYRNVYIDRRI